MSVVTLPEASGPTREVRAARIARLSGVLGACDLEAIVFTGMPDVAYYTGLRTEPYERLIGLVVRSDGEATLVVPRLEEPAVLALDPPVRLGVWDQAQEAIAMLAEAVGPAQRVAVDEERVSHGRALALSRALGGRPLVSAADVVAGVRLRKGPEEVAAVRAAARLLTPAVHDALSRARVGMTEIELARWLERRLQDDGSEHSHVIVLFGDHSGQPHATPGDFPLAEGEVVSIDATASVGGYNADITRCGTAGEASEWARRTWASVIAAHAAGVEASRPGASAHEVDASAREHQLACQVATPMHGVGHGLGLEIHERPYLVPGADATLAEGMVITIEPALYHPDHGGLRLESTVLVTDGAAEVLSGDDEELRRVAQL